MSQNESTPFLVTDAKNLTLIDAIRENLPWCSHYFVNILAIFYSNIKFLYNFQQPTEWAVRKCHQPFLKMLQGLRNKQKMIKPFF